MLRGIACSHRKTLSSIFQSRSYSASTQTVKICSAYFDDLVQKSKAAERSFELLVFCALGYSRSTAILCAWLIDQNFARDPEDALRIVQTERPWVRLNIEQMQYLHDYAQKLEF